MIYAKTDSTVKNREYAFTETFESVFEEDTFFNSCLQEAGFTQPFRDKYAPQRTLWYTYPIK